MPKFGNIIIIGLSCYNYNVDMRVIHDIHVSVKAPTHGVGCPYHILKDGRRCRYAKLSIISRAQKGAWFILLSILISLLLALFSGSLHIRKTIRANVPFDEFKAHMDKRIPALMKLYEIPGCSIALVKEGEIVWTEAYGYADVESGRTLRVDTPMSVQSITKSVTAWGIMRLAVNGLIDLDAPVSRYLKTGNFRSQTIRQRRLPYVSF